ncbi:MAG: hypothetical protein HGA85_01715, partial [Nanoarchaeota archaeon]|nr:hypothetical protein [Nanoarchaeota archaeon]
MNSKIAVGIALILLSFSFAHAVGVAPARTEVFYESLKETDIIFNVINNEQSSGKIALIAKGDLAEYITFESDSVYISSEEYQKPVKYKINFPVKMSPGQHTADIWVVKSDQDPSKAEGDILNVNIGVIHKLIVNVPYPDQFIDGMLYIKPALPGEEAEFTIMLSNIGTKDISSVKAQILITDPENQGVAKLSTNEIGLKQKEKSKIIAKWRPDQVQGTFKAQAIVEYDGGKIIVLEKGFDIGEPLLEIETITVESFRLGTIAKFDIMLKNTWNQDLINIFGDTEIRDSQGTIVSKYKTSAIDVPSFGRKELGAYWDTKQASEGDYMISVRRPYLGKLKEETYRLKVETDRITVNSLTGQVISDAPDSPTSNTWLFVLIGLVAMLSGTIVFLSMIKSRKQKSRLHQAQQEAVKAPVQS